VLRCLGTGVSRCYFCVAVQQGEVKLFILHRAVQYLERSYLAFGSYLAVGSCSCPCRQCRSCCERNASTLNNPPPWSLAWIGHISIAWGVGS
jgi:hypothetical protein